MTREQQRRTVLVTVTSAEGPPSLVQAAAQLGVAVSDLDESFGVLEIDKEQGIYCVEVDADRLPRSYEDKLPFQGPYSNPRIEHFGPVRPPPKSDQ